MLVTFLKQALVNIHGTGTALMHLRPEVLVRCIVYTA